MSKQPKIVYSDDYGCSVVGIRLPTGKRFRPQESFALRHVAAEFSQARGRRWYVPRSNPESFFIRCVNQTDKALAAAALMRIVGFESSAN
jgi:hypothetical protein